jgi:hypothetical protein
MPSSRITVTAEVLLHLGELLFFSALLEVQQLHLSFESALLLPEAFVLEFLLFQLCGL